MTDEKIIVVTPGSKLKIGLVAGAFLIIFAALAGTFWYLQQLRADNAKLASELVEQKKLTNTLIRASTKWSTKADLEKSLANLLTSDDLDALKKDIKGLGSKLTAVGHTVGSLGRKVAKLEKSDRQGPTSNPVVTCNDGRLVDVHGYTKRPQIKELKDLNDAPLADVTFNAAKDKPWSYEVHERRFHLVTAVSKKDSGQMAFHHTLKYEVPGKSEKTFPITLSSSEFLQVPQSKKFWWWNPKLDVNVFAGGRPWQFATGPGKPGNILSFGADLGFSFSSYGETKVDSLWRFFRFGVGYNSERQAAHLSFAPAAFNLGAPLPLLTNLYLTPQVAVDTAGGLTINMGLGFQL